MNYINNFTGTSAARLDFTDDGEWPNTIGWMVTIAKDNRFRILGKSDCKEDRSVTAIDLEGMDGMLKVGGKLPGYNKEIAEIKQLSVCKFMIYCWEEGEYPWCDCALQPDESSL